MSALAPLDSIQQIELLDWIDEARAQIGSSAAARLLTVDGIDAIDVLISPLYIAALAARREAPKARLSPASALYGRIRAWGYFWKLGRRRHKAIQASVGAEPTDVVLWTRDAAHDLNMIHVAKALSSLGKRSRLLASDPASIERLARRGQPAIYTEAVWPELTRKARQEGRQRAEALARRTDLSLPPLPRNPQLDPLHILRQTCLRNLPDACEAIVNARAVIERLRPKAIVVGNDLTLEGRAACFVARNAGVPTSVFMHGNITGNSMYSRHTADRIMVFGEIHRRILTGLQIPEERIVVTGAPHLDDMPRQSWQVDPLVQKQLGISTGQPWVLVATSGPGHMISHAHHAKVLDNIAWMAKSMPTTPIVVKLHRKDRVEYYQRIVAECAGTKLSVVGNEAPHFPSDIVSWLQGCPVVLTGGSFVAVQAMLLGVNVVTMDFHEELGEIDFINASATTHVRTREELMQSVQSILAKGQSPEVEERVVSYLQDFFYVLDGQSAKRGAEAIREQMAQ